MTEKRLSAYSQLLFNRKGGAAVLTVSGRNFSIRNFLEAIKGLADLFETPSGGAEPSKPLGGNPIKTGGDAPAAPKEAGGAGSAAATDEIPTPVWTEEDKKRNLGFLLQEVRNLNGTLSDYARFNNEPGFLFKMIDDLLYLTYSCLGYDYEVSEETKLFIVMCFLPLKQNLAKDRSMIVNLFKYDTISDHRRASLLEHWKIFSNEIYKVGGGKPRTSLRSLRYLAQYDTKNGTANFDRMAAAYYAYAQLVTKADGTVDKAKAKRLLKIRSLIYGEAASAKEEAAAAPPKAEETPVDETETLEEVMEKINGLIGMEKVKEQISTFINVIRVHKEREKRGLPVTAFTLHAVFYGPPGNRQDDHGPLPRQGLPLPRPPQEGAPRRDRPGRPRRGFRGPDRHQDGRRCSKAP